MPWYFIILIYLIVSFVFSAGMIAGCILASGQRH